MLVSADMSWKAYVNFFKLFHVLPYISSVHAYVYLVVNSLCLHIPKQRLLQFFHKKCVRLANYVCIYKLWCVIRLYRFTLVKDKQ